MIYFAVKFYLKKIHFKTANRESGALHADLPRGVHDALMVAPAKQEMIGCSAGFHFEHIAVLDGRIGHVLHFRGSHGVHMEGALVPQEIDLIRLGVADFLGKEGEVDRGSIALEVGCDRLVDDSVFLGLVD